MRDQIGKAPTAGEAAPRNQPRSVWRRLLGIGAAALGLYLTVSVTIRLIHRAEGYEPGAADCDDCGITLVLDNIGWLALAVVAYLGLFLLVSRVLRRRSRSGAGSSG